MAYGNEWNYSSEYDSDFITSELSFTVSYIDENKVILTTWENTTRHQYDEHLWLDMIQQIRCELGRNQL